MENTKNQTKTNKNKKRKILLSILIPVGVAVVATAIAVPCALTCSKKENVKVLNGITLSGTYKTTYNLGEKLDLTGLVVTASYADQSTKVLEKGQYTTNPAEGTTLLESTTITVSYSEGGVSASSTLDATVSVTDTMIIDNDGVAHKAKMSTICSRSGNIQSEDTKPGTTDPVIDVPREQFNYKVILPTNLTIIDQYFLENCKTFNQPFTIPNSVTEIKTEFLRNCESFNQPLTIPNNVTTINGNFLDGCILFNQPLTIPNSVTSIGDEFLYFCENFNSQVTLSNSLETIGDNFLASCSSFNQPLTLPTNNEFTSIDDYFLSGCEAFNQPLTIPNNITSIGDTFLVNCKEFNSQVTLSNSLNKIGQYFMSNCTKFNQEIFIPSGVKEIGKAFMASCNNFKNTIDFSLVNANEIFIYPKQVTGEEMLSGVPDANTIIFKVATGSASTWQTKLNTATARDVGTSPNVWQIKEPE